MKLLLMPQLYKHSYSKVSACNYSCNITVGRGCFLTIQPCVLPSYNGPSENGGPLSSYLKTKVELDMCALTQSYIWPETVYSCNLAYRQNTNCMGGLPCQAPYLLDPTKILWIKMVDSNLHRRLTDGFQITISFKELMNTNLNIKIGRKPLVLL